MWVIGAVIQVVINGLIFGVILQIASKIVLKDSIDFGDAFKTAIVASAGIIFGDYALVAMFDGGGYQVARIASYFLIWTLALMIVVGLDLVQSLLISVAFMVITWLVIMLFGLILGATLAVA